MGKSALLSELARFVGAPGRFYENRVGKPRVRSRIFLEKKHGDLFQVIFFSISFIVDYSGLFCIGLLCLLLVVFGCLCGP